jgi:hypothetical protein
MLCTAPSGVGMQLSSSVTLLGRASAATLAFPYTRTMLSSVISSPLSSSTSLCHPVVAAFVITVFGSRFGTRDTTPFVSIGTVPCYVSLWVSDSSTVGTRSMSILDERWIVVNSNNQSTLSLLQGPLFLVLLSLMPPSRVLSSFLFMA